MKRYRFILGIILIAVMESASLKCKAQSYIPLDWETTRGVSVSYNFSQEYLGSISCFGTPYWGEGLYYHSFGIGFPRNYKNVYSASVLDSIMTKLVVKNGDTIQLDYMRFKRDTTITDYSYGYIYYEPGINLGRYFTISCKFGLSFARSEEVVSGTPAYTTDITISNDSIINTPTGWTYHSNIDHSYSSHSGTSSKKQSEIGIGLLVGPNIIGHIPISNNKRIVMNVGYNFFLPLTPLEVPSKPNGLSVGLGIEWVLD